MTILHNFTAVSGQFSCPKCTWLASISRFYWHRVHNAPTLCRWAGKHFYGFRHFGATRSEFLKSFFGCQSFRLTLKQWSGRQGAMRHSRINLENGPSKPLQNVKKWPIENVKIIEKSWKWPIGERSLPNHCSRTPCKLVSPDKNLSVRMLSLLM